MRSTLSYPLAFCAHFITISAAALAYSQDGLTVQTNRGPVQGFYNVSAPNVRQFLSVPYAQPPIGDLRFAPPQPVSQRSAVLNTTAFGPSCMQRTSPGKTIYTEEVPQFLISGTTSEDCLYVNIWAPEVSASATTLLPVFVYIPGGGFTSGGANSVYKFPDQWIQRTQSHIVVVMNYRVNVFGFPNAPGLDDLNVGLRDQRMAVEWVYDNIANFGGDPDRITLWGQSAGAASVDLYAYSYPEQPLVSSLIADSGSATIVASADVQQTNFTYFAGLLNCTSNSSAAELACMRKLPATTIESTLSNYNGSAPLTFIPVYDNKTAFSNNTDRAVRGLVADIPAIFGSNNNEGAGFVPYTPDGPGAATLKAVTQSVIACPVAQEISIRELVGLPTYRYQYSGNFTNISPISWMGAYHSSELPLLFGTHYEYRSPSSFYEYEVSRFMEALWLSFASNPTKGPSITNGFAWPTFNSSADTMLELANGTTKYALVSGSIIDSTCNGLVSHSAGGTPA